MTNVEFQMAKECRMTNAEGWQTTAVSSGDAATLSQWKIVTSDMPFVIRARTELPLAPNFGVPFLQDALERFVGVQRFQIGIFSHPVEVAEPLLDRLPQIGQCRLPILDDQFGLIRNVWFLFQRFHRPAVGTRRVIEEEGIGHETFSMHF